MECTQSKVLMSHSGCRRLKWGGLQQFPGENIHNDMTRKRTSDKDLVVSGATGAAPARRNVPTRPRGQRGPETAPPLASAATEPETVAPEGQTVVTVNTPTYE